MKVYSLNYSALNFVFNGKQAMMSLEKGIDHFKSGEFEEALAIFNELIKKEEGQTHLHHTRARVLSRMGRTEEALQDFDRITEWEPYNTDFMSDRAVVLHLLKRNEEALSEFDRAVNLDPKNPYRYSSRAYFKDRIGDLMGAIADYEKTIELDPEDAVAYNNKGIVEEKIGYQQASKKSFKASDDLVGYTPGAKNTEEDKTAPKKEKLAIEKPKFSNPKKKVGISSYLKVVKSLFTDANTRKEFGSFLKRVFK